MNKKRVIIDSDPATGVRFRDVDDGLAILFLMASPEVTLEGITINFGNVAAEKGTRVASELLQISGKHIPLYTGAASKDELGKENPAVRYMIDTINSNPGEITILAVAPLTNVATAMMLDENFASNIGELIIMGGSISFRPFSFFGEFNFHLDGRAAARVLSEPVPKTMITMDVISQVVFRDEHLERLKEHTGEVNKYLVKAIEPWLKLNRKVFFRKKGFFPWDPVAAAWVTSPSLFDKNYFTLNVREKGIRSGSLTNLVQYNENTSAPETCPVNIPLSIDADGFMKTLIDRLNSFD